MMIRKLTFAFGALIALGATALTPTTASAWGWHHHHHYWRGWGLGYYGPTYVVAPSCYVVKKLVVMPDGTEQVRRFTVCN